jgi:hypothetical protein
MTLSNLSYCLWDHLEASSSRFKVTSSQKGPTVIKAKCAKGRIDPWAMHGLGQLVFVPYLYEVLEIWNARRRNDTVVDKIGLTPQSPTIQRSHSHSAPWPDFSHNTLVPWIHSRISPDSPTMSSSGSSLSEEQMRGRPPFFREYVTPQTVQRSTGMMIREIASRHVFLLNVSFQLIISPGQTRPIDGG